MTPLLLLALVASPHDQLGFGSAGAAVAGAAVAEPAGATAAFYNPAIVAGRDNVEAVIGYGAASMKLAINDIDQAIDTVRGVSFAIAAPLSLGELGRVGISLAATIPDVRLLRVRILPPDRPRFLMYDSRLQRFAADAAVSVARRFGTVQLGVAVGASILAGASGGGTTFYLRQGTDYQQADAAVSNELPLITAPLVAASARYGDLSLGFTLRGAIAFDLSLGTLADIRVGPLSGDIFTSVSGVSFYTPLKATLGFSWRLDSLRVHGSLELHRWSAAPSLTPVAVIDVSFEGLPIDLPVGRPAAQDLRDVLVPRIGAEKDTDLENFRVTWRVGAFFEPTPLKSDAPPVLLDANRIGAAVGVGLTTLGALGPFAEPVSLDVHVMGLQLMERRFASTGPADARPDIDISGYLISGGATITLRF